MTVSAQIFIAEAAGHLEVALHAGHHEQLLVLLRSLGKCVESTGSQTAGHQEVAGAFGRALGENRGLNLQEALLVEVVAHGLGDAVAQNHVALHSGAAKVQEAVLEADILVGNVAVQLERKHGSRVQHLHLGCLHLNLTRGQVRVRGINLIGLETAHHLTGHLDDRLHTQSLGLIGKISVNFRVENYLGLAGTVAEVDENHTAVVAHGVHPADQSHNLVYMSGAELIARMGTVTVHNEYVEKVIMAAYPYRNAAALILRFLS